MINHLQVLYQKATSQGDQTLFKVPGTDAKNSGYPLEWKIITYAQFLEHVERTARYYSSRLEDEGFRVNDVVGLWLTGDKYDDIVRTIGLARAGYVPQLTSVGLDSSQAVYDLLSKADAKALIYEPRLLSTPSSFPLPSFPAVPVTEILEDTISDCESSKLRPLRTNADDTAFILHTSGSSSTGPKLVRWSNRWIDSAFRKSGDFGTDFVEGQDVWSRGGKFCHISGIVQYFSMMHNNACMVLQPGSHISVDELRLLVQNAGVNCLFEMTPQLRGLFEVMRKDPALLRMVQDLRVIVTSGSPLHEDEASWCYANRIPLVMQYGMTECGLLLHSHKHDRPNILRTVPGMLHKFISFHDDAGELGVERTNTAGKLYEFVVLPDALEVPDRLLWKSEQYFDTGDVFEEVSPGANAYIFRGRREEWIANDMGERCDTKIIEDEIRKTCPELIHDCVVVGNDRPSAALIVEAIGTGAIDDATSEALKSEILRRTKDFNDCRHTYERIVSPELILVVEKGMLPRTGTKGNIRRKVTEETYAKTLDHMFSLAYPAT